MLDLVLIPVTHAITAGREALERQWKEHPMTDAEVRDLSAVLVRCVYMSEVFVRYAQALGGKPSRN